MRFAMAFGLLGMVFGMACTHTPNHRITVQNVGADDLLKLRTGPGLGYSVILGLPDNTTLISHGCVAEGGQGWCRVSLAQSRQITGYVSEEYLDLR